jgi:Eco29kI restriction endonuclease
VPLTALDRKKHQYKNDAFVELVKDAVGFFNSTPLQSLPLPDSFIGSGVYGIYYTGKLPLYQAYANLNYPSCRYPIYIGKAVPKGSRQALLPAEDAPHSRELFTRLREQSRNIAQGEGLLIEDFQCRFVIFEDAASDMINAIQAALIKLNKPLWNKTLDGFGNHDPGKGRYEQAKSDWDVIHPGRKWAAKCKGVANQESEILSAIAAHFKTL